jgi:hypothetical protein
MAVQLNAAFNEIINNYGESFDEIAVGVFYGKKDGLTDKYDILRGINRGKNHNVVDLTSRVNVYAGKDFWAWLNDGEERTQSWVLDGIRRGLATDNSREECGALLANFERKVAEKYQKYFETNEDVDWDGLLKEINGA